MVRSHHRYRPRSSSRWAVDGFVHRSVLGCRYAQAAESLDDISAKTLVVSTRGDEPLETSILHGVSLARIRRRQDRPCGIGDAIRKWPGRHGRYRHAVPTYLRRIHSGRIYRILLLRCGDDRTPLGNVEERKTRTVHATCTGHGEGIVCGAVDSPDERYPYPSRRRDHANVPHSPVGTIQVSSTANVSVRTGVRGKGQ